MGDIITKLTLSEYKKIAPLGCRKIKIKSGNGYRLGYDDETPIALSIEDIKLAREGENKNIAVFIAEKPTPDEVQKEIDEHKEYYEALFPSGKPTEGEPMPYNKQLKWAWDIVMASKAPFEKYFWNDGATYCIWCGVRHIYQRKTYFEVDADTECGRIRKKGIARIYLVDVSGALPNVFKESEPNGI